jgi:hypothetical protein
MLDHQDVEEVSLVNKSSFMSMVERLTIQANIGSHPAGESMVRQKDGDINCTSSTLSDTIHFQSLF